MWDFKFFSFQKSLKKVKTITNNDKSLVVVMESKKDGHRFLRKTVYYKTDAYDKLKDVKSKYIPEIYNIEKSSSRTVISEEYIDGISLRTAIEEGLSLKMSQKLFILTEICRGLEVIHDMGLIHRDIKPSNIMLLNYNDEKPQIKIIDFETLREYKEDKIKDTQVLGTEGFSPPEQYGCGQTDCRSDIYAFGVLMNDFLDGGKSLGIKKVIAKCTAFDPNRRYKTIKAVRREIYRAQLSEYIYSAELVSLAALGAFYVKKCKKSAAG